MAEILSVSRKSVKKVQLVTVADLMDVLQDMRTRFQYCQVGILGVLEALFIFIQQLTLHTCLFLLGRIGKGVTFKIFTARLRLSLRISQIHLQKQKITFINISLFLSIMSGSGYGQGKGENCIINWAKRLENAPLSVIQCKKKII